MFPLEYQDEIEIPRKIISDVADYQKQLLIKASENLQKAKARDIKIEGDKLTFNVDLFRWVSRWNILNSIEGGYIKITSDAQKVIVSYMISFRKLFIFGILITVCVGIYISWDAQLSALQTVLLMAVLWLSMVGLNWIIPGIRYPRFIERIIRETPK